MRAYRRQCLHRPPDRVFRHEVGVRARHRCRAARQPISRRDCRISPARSRVRQFKGGQSNPTYLLETPARRYVLRRKPPGKLLPSAHAVDREFRVISALHAQGFPVAAPVLYCADDKRRRHAVLRDGLRRRPRVLGAAHAGFAAGRARGGLRCDERDARAAAFVRSGRDRAWRFRPRRELRRRARSSAGRSSTAPPRPTTIDEMERLIAWLPAHLPPPAPVRLVHGDYRLDNIILSPARPTFSRCSTGSCRRSAIRSPISPIT